MECSTPFSNLIALYLNRFRRKPAISRFDWLFQHIPCFHRGLDYTFNSLFLVGLYLFFFTSHIFLHLVFNRVFFLYVMETSWNDVQIHGEEQKPSHISGRFFRYVIHIAYTKVLFEFKKQGQIFAHCNNWKTYVNTFCFTLWNTKTAIFIDESWDKFWF